MLAVHDAHSLSIFVDGVLTAGQGLERVHFSAQRKHNLWDTLGA